MIINFILLIAGFIIIVIPYATSPFHQEIVSYGVTKLTILVVIVFSIASDLILTGYSLYIMWKLHQQLIHTQGHSLVSEQAQLTGNQPSHVVYRRLIFAIAAAGIGMVSSSVIGIGSYALSRSMIST
jgi:hypothetical protein